MENDSGCGFTLIAKESLDGYPAFLKTEAAIRSVLQRKVFLEMSQNSQENTCVRASFLIKL